ncbi:MAG: hypothetical protein KAH21_10330, partial [Spirochaetaceae bacterium]|nr:hypothetical protein [Spirochaetaceae bacterium]
DPVLPFWGDLYLGDEPILLWRASKRGFVLADIDSAHEMNRNISDIARLDEAPWNEDLERLLRLINSLGQGGQGPLTAEQLAILSQPEKEKDSKQPVPVSPVKTVSADSAKPRISEKQGLKTDTAEFKSVKKADVKKSGSRKWIWLLLLILFLLGGAVIWDLTGKAPWGSVLTNKTADLTDNGGIIEGKGNADSSTDSDSTEGSASTTGSDSTEGSDSTTSSDSTEGSDSTTSSSNSDNSGNADSSSTAGNQIAEVDSDVAPRNLDEVKAYLDVGGRVAITEVDIHLAANEIAVLNGYKDLEYKVYTGEDPNWIYPERLLQMPGTGNYTIKRGDTIWFLAAREVRVDAEKNMKIYDQSVSALDNTGSSAAEKSNAAENLRLIAEGSRAAAMRNMARNELSSRKL